MAVNGSDKAHASHSSTGRGRIPHRGGPCQLPSVEPYDASARRLTQGETGEGTEFELEIKGFGKVLQELQEFSPNRQVRLVPHFKMLTSGHRFLFAADGNSTRIDLELEMTPKGFFKIFTPVMGMIGRKNLRGTAKALQDYMKGKERSAILL